MEDLLIKLLSEHSTAGSIVVLVIVQLWLHRRKWTRDLWPVARIEKIESQLSGHKKEVRERLETIFDCVSKQITVFSRIDANIAKMLRLMKQESQTPRVLIVEDDNQALQLMSDMVKDVGLDCHTARKYHEAIDLMTKNRYSMIMADYNLANSKTGKDVLRDADVGTYRCLVSGSDVPKEELEHDIDLYMRKEQGIEKMKSTIKAFFPKLAA